MRPIALVTYNIHKGFSTAGSDFVLEEIRAKIESTKSDLVFIQEIQGEHTKKKETIEEWPNETQFEFLAERMWPHFAYGKNAIYRLGHHGNAILSRFPFDSWENINVSFMKNASRSILHGQISIPSWKKQLHVMCVHFGLFGFERKNQVLTLMDRLMHHVPMEEPLLIAGDFNDWMGNAEKGFRDEFGLRDTFKELTGKRAKTFPSWLPLLPLDRIYFRGLEPLRCERLEEETGRSLSDHLALYAEFEPSV